MLGLLSRGMTCPSCPAPFRVLATISHVRYISHLENPYSTLKVTCDMRPRMGRKKLWPERMDAMLPDGTFERMDEARLPGETRTDLIRLAVERELQRREAENEGP
jgi:hypothetical protein